MEKDPDTGFSIKKWDDGIWMRSKEMHAGGRESRGQRVSEGRPVGEGRRAAEGAGSLHGAARGPVSTRGQPPGGAGTPRNRQRVEEASGGSGVLVPVACG